MFSLKSIIFNFFGIESKINDSLKDGSGKGIWERYNESLGEDYDEDVSPLITNLMDNVIVPLTMFVRFIDIQNEALGSLPVPSIDVNVKRKILQHFNILGTIKGTVKSYRMLFSFIGVNLDSNSDVNPGFGWDSDTGTLDDADRTFDTNLSNCRYYSLELSGVAVISSDLESAINIINDYLRPLNAVTFEIKYNGTPITLT